MKYAQKQYELGFKQLFSNERINLKDYFRSLDVIKTRPNQYPLSKRVLIKKNLNEPYKDLFVIEENKILKNKLYTIESRPVLPKINSEYEELEKRLRTNKEIYRKLHKKALSIENDFLTERVFSQKPKVITNKILEKLYEENHQSYKKLRSAHKRKYNNESHDYNNIPLILPKIYSRNKVSRTEANLDSDKEQSKDNSLDLKDHKYNEISHQKPGHIEG